MKQVFRVCIDEELDGHSERTFAWNKWASAIAFIVKTLIAHGENNGHSRKLTISIDTE